MVIIDIENCTAWYHLPVYLLRSCENPWFLGFNGNEQIKTATHSDAIYNLHQNSSKIPKRPDISNT